jgi:hypothetical protein
MLRSNWALMTFRRLSRLILFGAFTLLTTGLFSYPLVAQGPLPDGPTSPVESASPVVIAPSLNDVQHKFWDRKNQALFAATAALNVADFAVTRSNLQRGGQELNPLARMFGRSTPGLAANFAGEAAGVISLSYFLHKTGHYKLERAVSMVNMAGSAGAVTYGLTHR